MTHLTTWQDRIIWSSRFIGLCLLLIAFVRPWPGYLVASVAALLFGFVADWLIPDHVRTVKPREERQLREHSPEHA